MMQQRLLWILMLNVMLMILIPVSAHATRDWTIMVYISGDNDLEPFALKDLNEMELGVPGPHVEVIALVDRAKGYSNDEGDWTDTRLFRIKPDKNIKKVNSPVLKRLKEVNTGDPATLSRFIEEGISRYPARHYALILWDHGGGWRQMAHDHDTPEVKGGDHLDIKEVREAVTQGLSKSKTPKLDVIGFDMCLMAQMEMAYELKDLAQYMVASQAIEPGDGWPYDLILPTLTKKGTAPIQLVREIVAGYGRFYKNRGDKVATLSALNLAHIEPVRENLDRLLNEIASSNPKDAWPAVGRSIFWAETYSDRGDFRAKHNALASVDIVDLFKRMKQSWDRFPDNNAYRAFLKGVESAVVANFTTDRHRLSHGLAVYAPVMGAFFNDAYRQTAFSKQSKWVHFLSGLYGFQRDHQGKPAIVSLDVISGRTGQKVDRVQMGKGFKLNAVVEGNNILWVQALVCEPDPEKNSLTILQKGYFFDPEYFLKQKERASDLADLLMPEFTQFRNEISQNIMGMQFLVTDGKNAGAATIDQSNFRDLEHVAISALLLPKGEKQEYYGRIYFNTGTWLADQVVAQIPQPDGQMVFRQVELRPEDQVTLLLESVDNNGESTFLTGTKMTWGDGLELILNEAMPGNYKIAARAENLAGKSVFKTVDLSITPLSQAEKQSLENAKTMGPKYLKGTWHWFLMTGKVNNGKPVYLDMKTTARFIPTDQPGVYQVQGKSETNPEFGKNKKIAILDTRLLPTLRLLSFNEENRFLGADNFLVLMGEVAKGRPLVALGSLDPSGLVIGLAREEMYQNALNAGLILPMDGSAQGQESTASQSPSPQGTFQAPPTANTPPPQPPQQTPQAPPSINIAGVWQNQSVDQFGYPMFTQIRLSPDGQFYQRQQSQSGLVLDLWGTYMVGNGYIQFANAGWNPPQLCFGGRCQAVNFPPINNVPFQMLNANMIQTPSGNYTRIE